LSDIAKLIKNGHSEAYSYGVSFFYTSLDQINDEIRKNIQYTAIAVRGAKSEDFKQFLELFDTKREKDAQIDHKSNLDLLNKKL